MGNKDNKRFRGSTQTKICPLASILSRANCAFVSIIRIVALLLTFWTGREVGRQSMISGKLA